MNRYDDYTVEELREELQRFFLYSDLDDDAVDEMEKILAVLREKAPFEHPHTTEEMWAEFKAEHAEELSNLGIPKNEDTEGVIKKDPEEAADTGAAVVVPITGAGRVPTVSADTEPRHGKRSQKLIRTALIAAAVVAVMVIATVSAAAAGIDIWKWVQVRGEGTVKFVAEDALSKDIPAALKQASVEEPLFPTWIPEGFLLFDQQIRLDDSIHINATYVFKDKIIAIIIRSLNDDTSKIIEIEDVDPHEYIYNGIIHFIIPNCEQLDAYWVNNGYLVKISGDITEEEIERIIRSVYGDV
jgi:hypothetical protein